MRRYAAVAWFLLSTSFIALSQTGAQNGASNPADQQPNGASAAVQAKIDPAKEADIRKLLELTGAKALMVQNMSTMEQTIRPVITNSLPPGDYREKLVDLFLAKFHSKADPTHMVDLAVPLYDKYLSHEEIKGLIQFYQTPLGQKSVSVLPKLTTELVRAGQEWGRQIGGQAMQEVLAEHPDLADALETAGKAKP